MKIQSLEDGIEAAKKVALLSPYKTHKVGAIITDKRGNVLGLSCNRKKTHPMQAKYAALAGDGHKIRIHAEIGAIINSNKALLMDVGHTIYVARITKRGHIGLAKPCPICSLALADYGIEIIHHTT